MAGRKNGEEGYVLGWVVVMVMILMILVTGILFATSAYYRVLGSTMTGRRI